MSSIQLDNIFAPLPSTQRNVTMHLSYDATTDSLAYPCGKSAFIRFLTDDLCIQFTGHGSANVTVVKFSPVAGSQYLCSGDDTGKIIIWSWSYENKVVETKIKCEFQVLSGPISDLSWDFEGLRLCVVGEGRDKFGVFVSWDSGNSLGEMTGHSKKINACHFKQSRPMRCITVGDDGAVIFHHGPPFKFVASDRIHHDQGRFIRDVKFSPGIGKYAITVGSDRKIVCFDGRTGEYIKYINDPDEIVEGGIFALDWIDSGDNSRKFITSSADCVLRLWDVESGKCEQRWSLDNQISNQQVGVVTTRDQTIISLSLDGSLNFFKIGCSNLVKRIVGHNKGITALSVNPLVTGSYDGKIINWTSNATPLMYNNHENMIISLNTLESQISTVSWDDTLRITTTTTSEIKHKFSQQPKIASSFNKFTAVVTNNNRLLILDSLRGDIIHDILLEGLASAITLGSQYVVVAYEQPAFVQVFNVPNLDVTFNLSSNILSKLSCLSLSPSEKYLAVGDIMGKIILYDLTTKEIKTSRWSFHTGKITGMSWMPVMEEEDRIATASLDTNIIIYSMRNPMRVVKYLNAHKDGINCICWENSNTVISAGADSCIKKWRVKLL